MIGEIAYKRVISQRPGQRSVVTLNLWTTELGMRGLYGNLFYVEEAYRISVDHYGLFLVTYISD